PVRLDKTVDVGVVEVHDDEAGARRAARTVGAEERRLKHAAPARQVIAGQGVEGAIARVGAKVDKERSFVVVRTFTKAFRTLLAGGRALADLVVGDVFRVDLVASRPHDLRPDVRLAVKRLVFEHLVRRKGAALRLARVHLEHKTPLLQVVLTARATRSFTGARKRRQQDRRKDADDGNYDEQLDQGET